MKVLPLEAFQTTERILCQSRYTVKDYEEALVQLSYYYYFVWDPELRRKYEDSLLTPQNP